MNHTVLLVEDEVELREMIQEALELSGYSVVAASDGREALDAIARIDHVCLVLLDLLMPGMNGWDFFETMRARPELAAIPVVVHSSQPAQAPAGVDRVLQKPVKLDRLLATVSDFCAQVAPPT
jgi:CheY-like chemotaxis protein